jgi:hypothetical protein
VPDLICFALDEHIAPAVAAGLRRRGVDVTTSQEAGLLGASDEQQMAHATADGRVFVTQDADFLRLAASGIPHAGVVYAPQGTPIGALIHGLMEIAAILDAATMINHIDFL